MSFLKKSETIVVTNEIQSLIVTMNVKDYCVDAGVELLKLRDFANNNQCKVSDAKYDIVLDTKYHMAEVIKNNYLLLLDDKPVCDTTVLKFTLDTNG